MSEVLELIAVVALVVWGLYMSRRVSILEQQVQCLAGECDHEEEWTEDQL